MRRQRKVEKELSKGVIVIAGVICVLFLLLFVGSLGSSTSDGSGGSKSSIGVKAITWNDWLMEKHFGGNVRVTVKIAGRGTDSKSEEYFFKGPFEMEYAEYSARFLPKLEKKLDLAYEKEAIVSITIDTSNKPFTITAIESGW